MKIALYDMQHFEMMYVWFSILNTGEHELVILTSPEIQQKFIASSADRLQNVQFLIHDHHTPPEEYFNHCLDELKKQNTRLLLLNTIDKDYKETRVFLSKVPFPYCITIHNINTWLAPPFTLNRVALSNYYNRKKMVKGSAAIVVQEELFIRYIRNKNLYPNLLFTVPHTLKENGAYHTSNPKTVIAIPGGIDGVRRDYHLTLDAIEEFHTRNHKAQFVFIGKVMGHLGEMIWKRMEELKSKGCNIEHYYDESSNKVFDEQMSRCDIVFLPLNVHTRYEGIKEIYGTTKVTGVLYDMMRFSKPGIVPHEMVIPPVMSKSVITYRNKDELLGQFISFCHEKEKISALKKAAEADSDYYSVEKIRQRVLPEIQKLTGN